MKKDNTEKAEVLINQAIKLCNDFTLSSARAYPYAAMREIDKVNKKRSRREMINLQIENQFKQKKEQLEILRKKLIAEQKQIDKIEKLEDDITDIDSDSDN